MNNNINMAEIQLSENEINAAITVLRSGALRQGAKCSEFESLFASKIGANHASTCSSGSAALHLAYLSCLEPGDEVLVPSFTFIATASMAAVSGFKPVLVDIDPDTWLIDLEDARKKVTDKTKAIAPVHVFGNVCPIPEVKAFAEKYNLKIIWDAAQAHGGEYDGFDIGSFGDFTCYSFYPSKNMFVGEGGMVTTNNDVWAEKINFLKSHGQTGKYYHTMLGLNYRMTDVEAAIGINQLARLDSMLNIRRENAAILAEALVDIPGINIQKITPNSTHAFHQFCVLIEKENFGLGRDDVADELKKMGISTGVHYPRGLHQQPILIEMYGEISLPVCENVCENILALPIHHGLCSDDIKRIIKALQGLSNI
jgi:dTDP-4-amino-4,6-dideoxygalactose transaminase